VSSPADDELRPPSRRATQAQRRFGPDELASLDRGERRKLCHALLTEGGEQVVEFQAPAAHDELVLQVAPLWTRRTVRVRIAAREVDQAALDRLAERVAEANDAEGMMITAHGIDEGALPDVKVRVVEPTELIARLERSALIAWPNGMPELSYQRLGMRRTLTADAVLLDPVGIRWLPTLALNELPPDIVDLGKAPQDLLERMTFRLFTASLRFGGKRLGESERGQRLPDSLLTWPADSPVRHAAVVDCKAAGDGYTMTADHELRLAGYVDGARESVEATGHELRYIVVVSSEFPGSEGSRHPYRARNHALRERAGVTLVYLRAVDLARLALAIEASEMGPAAREALHWSDIFDRGLLGFEDLEELLA
jgi:hypothetical protein